MAFNPRDHLIKLPARSRGGNPIDYLPVKERVRWLRDDHADAEIAIQVIELTETRAVMHVRVSIPGGGSAEAIGSEYKAVFSDYIEKAGTVALGRALAILGYGLEFADELELDKAEADPRDYEINMANTVAETTKGRPTAAEMRQRAKAQQNGSAPADPDALPEDAGGLVAWYNAQLATLPAYQWSKETITANAKGLAMRFKNAGLSDAERRAVYLALTGKEHGSEFTPQQIAAMNKVLADPEKLRALAARKVGRLDPAAGG